MKHKASTSHDEAMVRELRENPDFAAEYLRAALEDAEEPRVLLVALRRVAEARGRCCQGGQGPLVSSVRAGSSFCYSFQFLSFSDFSPGGSKWLHKRPLGALPTGRGSTFHTSQKRTSGPCTSDLWQEEVRTSLRRCF
jgi:hypothetical protein